MLRQSPALLVADGADARTVDENLAIAIESQPMTIDNIERLVVMGGAFGGRREHADLREPGGGRIQLLVDPVAADRGISTSVDITLVPLDATNDVPISPSLYDTLSAVAGDTAVVTALIRDYVAENPFTGGICHWDDLTAATLTDSDLVEIEERTVRIRTDAGPLTQNHRGRTRFSQLVESDLESTLVSDVTQRLTHVFTSKVPAIVKLGSI